MSRGWGPRTGRPLPEAMVLKETRSNSQIPTPFPHRFPLNSHALTSVEGLVGQDEIDAAIQTTSTSKARRVDFGGCGPLQRSKSTARRPSDSRFKGSETSEGRGPRNGYGVFHAEVAGSRLNDPVNTGEVASPGRRSTTLREARVTPTSPLAGPTRDPRGAVARPSLDPRSTLARPSLGRRASAESALN